MAEYGWSKEARGGGSLGGFSVGGCRKQRRRRRSKMKRERRRGGIYRSWIMKVMQINKGEGVFAKVRGLGISLGHLADHDEEKGVGLSWK